jgi:hypothetical protein
MNRREFMGWLLEGQLGVQAQPPTMLIVGLLGSGFRETPTQTVTGLLGSLPSA